MRRMPYNLQAKGGLQVASGIVGATVPSAEVKTKKEGSYGSSNEPISVLDTQRSPSPSTSTSTFSSSFGGVSGGGSSGSTEEPTLLPPAAGSELTPSCGGSRKEDWISELQPISMGPDGSSQRLGVQLEDWEILLSDCAAFVGPEQSLLRPFTGDGDCTVFSLKQLLQSENPNETESLAAGYVGIDQNLGQYASGNEMTTLNSTFAVASCSSKVCSVPNCSSLNTTDFNSQNPSVCLPTGLAYQQQHQIEGKTRNFNPVIVMNEPIIEATINPSVLSYDGHQEEPQIQPLPKRHNTSSAKSRFEAQKAPFFVPGPGILDSVKPQVPQLQNFPTGMVQHVNNFQSKSLLVPKKEAVESSGQMGVQFNHHHYQQFIYNQLYEATELILSGNFSYAQGILARLNQQLSPPLKPLQRAAFYFKEALHLPLMPSPPPKISSPFDFMLKMAACKVLYEVSPLVQFMNFTSNQALLEALEGAERIHIVDFDIGFGAQWASFMQELPKRNGISPSLKITAFASPSTHQPVEIALMHENLTQFASENGLSFELEVVNSDAFDPNSYSVVSLCSSENVAVAVNFPLWSSSTHMSALPSLLRFVKQLSPKIMVTLDHSCERKELPVSEHFLHALQYYEVLFDSIDAANVYPDMVNKIEKFLFQPRIESIVLERLRSPDPMPHWKTIFASLGFSPVSFSNFAETMAECVVKRTQVRGFEMKKSQSSLVLCWQNRELMSASAWKC